jgi:hypothetical protein
LNTPFGRLNDNGIARFREYLAKVRAGEEITPPFEVLNSNECCVPIASAPMVTARAIGTKREAATYLHELIDPLQISDLRRDVGLWSWLGLFFFDAICPLDGEKRKVKADAHYILDLQHTRVYRHLLRTPYQVLESIPKYNSLFLEQPVSTHGELIEQVFGGRLFVIRLPAVAQVVERLYFDAPRRRPKFGFTSESRRGNLRKRLPVRVQQLMLTYDVAGMSADQLLDALGDEFSVWLDR